jgi:hypothetical protein
MNAGAFGGVPARARTVDPLIKSQLLYQLSYRDNFVLERESMKN